LRGRESSIQTSGIRDGQMTPGSDTRRSGTRPDDAVVEGETHDELYDDK
jgi:hypothetical protein